MCRSRVGDGMLTWMENRGRPWWLDPRSQMPENSAAARFMRWTLRPLILFAGKPRPLLIGAIAVMQLFVVAWRTFVEHRLPIGGVALAALCAWLTVRQWHAKQRYPDGYPWATDLR
jgi:hypothetical protein